MSSKLEQRFIEFIRARKRVKKLLLAKADDLENYLKKARIAKVTHFVLVRMTKLTNNRTLNLRYNF